MPLPRFRIRTLMIAVAVVGIVCTIPKPWSELVFWIGPLVGYFIRVRGRRGGIIGSAVAGIAMAWVVGLVVAVSAPTQMDYPLAIRGAVLLTALGATLGAGVALALASLELLYRVIISFPGRIRHRAQRSAAANAEQQ